MRPTKTRRPTQKGLGDPTEEPATEEAPPPSSRGVVVVPPSEPSLGRYSVRPAPTETREFKSPVGPSMKRRNTDRMPAHVDETPRSGAVRAIAASAVPRRLAPQGAIEHAPLGSREAFVLSLIDGQASVTSLEDVSGLDEAELRAILDRLVVLKLVALG